MTDTEKRRATLEDLKDMTELTISNTLAAEILGMHPQTLAAYAKNGELQWATICSGNRVKHGRISFIEFWGGKAK